MQIQKEEIKKNNPKLNKNCPFFWFRPFCPRIRKMINE